MAAGKHTIMALENGCNVSGDNGSGNGSGNNPAVPYGTAKTATFTGYVNTGALNVRKQPDQTQTNLCHILASSRTQKSACAEAQKHRTAHCGITSILTAQRARSMDM